MPETNGNDKHDKTYEVVTYEALGALAFPGHDPYNLIVRDIELEVIPACRHYGLGIIPWSPLQGGLLGGVIQKENTAWRTGPRLATHPARGRGTHHRPANPRPARQRPVFGGAHALAGASQSPR